MRAGKPRPYDHFYGFGLSEYLFKLYKVCATKKRHYMLEMVEVEVDKYVYRV